MPLLEFHYLEVYPGRVTLGFAIGLSGPRCLQTTKSVANALIIGEGPVDASRIRSAPSCCCTVKASIVA